MQGTGIVLQVRYTVYVNCTRAPSVCAHVCARVCARGALITASPLALPRLLASPSLFYDQIFFNARCLHRCDHERTVFFTPFGAPLFQVTLFSFYDYFSGNSVFC